MTPLGPEEFQAAMGVSRETLDRLAAYLALLAKWQARINLVAASTLVDPWRRHMLDSAQLFPLLPPGARRLLDIGSGAGFPGLVLAVMGVPEVHLVESDGRKCAFLREAARCVGLRLGERLSVHHRRVEDVTPFPADVVTARALAEVGALLDLAAPFLHGQSISLFLKGRNVDLELTEAEKRWKFEFEKINSRSDPAGAVLRMGNIRRE